MVAVKKTVKKKGPLSPRISLGKSGIYVMEHWKSKRLMELLIFYSYSQAVSYAEKMSLKNKAIKMKGGLRCTTCSSPFNADAFCHIMKAKEF